MIRRLKHDLREIGEEFPERKVVRIDIEGLPEDAPELVLSHLLQRYRRAREARLEDATRSQRASALLVVISLQKRLLSSIEAFARTLDVHRRAMKRQVENAAAPPAAPRVRPETLSLLVSPLGSDDERAELPEEEGRYRGRRPDGGGYGRIRRPCRRDGARARAARRDGRHRQTAPGMSPTAGSGISSPG